MNQLQSIADNFYQELHEDYVGLWEIVGRVSQDAELAQSEVRKSVLSIVADLLRRENVVAGKFKSRRFVEWNEVPEQVIKRIDQAWDSLGRSPNIADDVCWFALIKDS
jgi:hypothetical protein